MRPRRDEHLSCEECGVDLGPERAAAVQDEIVYCQACHETLWPLDVGEPPDDWKMVPSMNPRES